MPIDEEDGAGGEKLTLHSTAPCAQQGLGTNDWMLIRILVWRSEIDLEEVKKQFQDLFGVSLAKASVHKRYFQ